MLGSRERLHTMVEPNIPLYRAEGLREPHPLAVSQSTNQQPHKARACAHVLCFTKLCTWHLLWCVCATLPTHAPVRCDAWCAHQRVHIRLTQPACRRGQFQQQPASPPPPIVAAATPATTTTVAVTTASARAASSTSSGNSHRDKGQHPARAPGKHHLQRSARERAKRP